MLFTEKWLATIFVNNQNVNEQSIIQRVFIDSREVVEQGLFIPIVGERFDGHDFVLQAIDHGATAILWEKDKPLPKEIPEDITVYYVEDTTKALQFLAWKYKDYIQPKVIGITGSNGKTSTKDLVAAVVKSTYNTHYTKGNLNNHIGLPLTILSMPRDTEVLVLEMGMNAFGEIDLLSKIANPDLAIITNIGESHIEFLGSREGIIKAKLEIRNGMKNDGILIIDGDEEQLIALHEDQQVITCGFKEDNEYIIENVYIDLGKTSFTIKKDHKYEIPLVGEHHAKNASYAIVVGKLLNIPTETIKKGLKDLKHTGMRFELVEGKNGVTLVNDAYNASPTSMIGAINILRSFEQFKYKVLVLGDVFELGSHAKVFHREIGEQIKEPITAVFTYGTLAKEISKTVTLSKQNIQVKHAESKEEILNYLEPYIHSESIILFKASRGMEFEQFIHQLKQE